ncbi:MAG: DUF3592 domain-containing protein, partial [Planctomycetota bacterium]
FLSVQTGNIRMNWFTKNYIRLRFQKRVDALKKAGIPVNQKTVYDETIDVGVPVPTVGGDKRAGHQQSDHGVNRFAVFVHLLISSIPAFFRFLVMPRGPTVFDEANRSFWRSGGFGRRLRIALFLASVGLVAAIWSGMVVFKGIASSSWPVATGLIQDSGIETEEDMSSASGRRNRTYTAKVRYTYSVGQKNFTADRVCFGYYGGSDGRRARTIRARYPVGATVSVHYNPQQPEQSVLETGSTWFMNLWFTLGALMAFCGFIGVVRAINAYHIYRRAEHLAAQERVKACKKCDD